MRIEGVKASVLGWDASSLRAFDLAVFTQSGQLVRMGSALAIKCSLPFSLPLSAGITDFTFPLVLTLTVQRESEWDPSAFGRLCGRRWLRREVST